MPRRAQCIAFANHKGGTGEEPYSIAMLLPESLGQEIALWDVSILGTDIDSKALEPARDRLFGPSEVGCISPAWLDKYFLPRNGGFCVHPALKQLVTFEMHNLVSDPPYQDMDLVVCRNVLIYFNPTLQNRVLRNFHQGLRDGGFLLLGRAELPAGETKTLIDCVDAKARLFQKLERLRNGTAGREG
jgi:chemotaxis methyl-accepting protein methylase